VGFDQRTKIQIFGRTLGFSETAEIDAIRHGLILQIALTALIANRAIKRVVDQKEFHHAFAGLFDHRRICFHNGRLAFGTGAQILDLHCTGGRWFWWTANNFDQTHPAVACDGKPFMIAETGDLDPSFFTGLYQGHCPVNFDLISINDDFAQIRHGVSYVFPIAFRSQGTTRVAPRSNATGPATPVRSTKKPAIFAPLPMV
jgi:hypothetical protein